ncbi:DUF2625 family protein [Kitasatospora sp. NPDC101183]|uniref:DUF2625 family protein n=1 Tax=Kitasatospora sp. NPDC101183 TaxID=3364100 RepID=UPI00380E6D24
MRALEDLIAVDDPAWPVLGPALAAAGAVRVLPPADPEEGRRCLLQLQVSARSTLGALVLHTGGLLVDGGWLRVLGGGGGAGGSGDLPGLGRANRFPAAVDPGWHPAAALVVGYDVLGGVFALNGHDPAAAGRPGAPGQMTYFAPDTLAWEAMETGHSGWIAWLLDDRLDQFYDGLRHPGWREETAALGLGEGFTVYPFLWSEEGQRSGAAASRRPAPMSELLGVAGEFARQMGLADPGFLGEL